MCLDMRRSLYEKESNNQSYHSNCDCGINACVCTVSIVKEEAVPAFIENVGKAYKDKIGYAADFYVVEIGDGPSVL